jgi:hypothetical protein
LNKKFRECCSQKNIFKAFFIIFIFLFSAKAIADTVNYFEVKSILLDPVFNTKERWRVSAFEPNIEYYKEIPAKICFERLSESDQQTCFYSEVVTNHKTYRCQFVKKLSPIFLLKNQVYSKAIIFTAEYSMGGSGSLELITLWSYNKKKNSFVNLLPPVAITNQGEYQFFTDLKENIGCLFITADYIGGENETHFSPHRYLIKIYKYDLKRNKFRFIDKYETKAKYKSLNDVDEISVIKFEKKKIINKIFLKKGR